MVYKSPVVTALKYVLLGVTSAVKRSFVEVALVDVTTSSKASSVIQFSVAEKSVVISSCKIPNVVVAVIDKVSVMEAILDAFVVAASSIFDFISVLKPSTLSSVVTFFNANTYESTDAVENLLSYESVVVKVFVDDLSKVWVTVF